MTQRVNRKIAGVQDAEQNFGYPYTRNGGSVGLEFMPMNEARDTTSTAVERALTILEAVGQRAGGMTNSEISRRLGIPKSSASYILRVLERRGYLHRDASTGRYRLGLELLTLARGVETGDDVREAALPILRQLADRCRLTAHLGVIDQHEAVYLEKAEVPGLIKMGTYPGCRTDCHSTSIGKAILAHVAGHEVEAVARERGLAKRTPRTITSLARLRRELDTVRARGYAVDDEENNLGVRCVAAPIFDATGHVVASINVSGTTGQIVDDALPKIAEAVKDAARRVSQKLGYVPVDESAKARERTAP
jgi:IclR family KDG regulon transcriptional repressor